MDNLGLDSALNLTHFQQTQCLKRLNPVVAKFSAELLQSYFVKFPLEQDYNREKVRISNDFSGYQKEIHDCVCR